MLRESFFLLPTHMDDGENGIFGKTFRIALNETIFTYVVASLSLPFTGMDTGHMEGRSGMEGRVRCCCGMAFPCRLYVWTVILVSPWCILRRLKQHSSHSVGIFCFGKTCIVLFPVEGTVR